MSLRPTRSGLTAANRARLLESARSVFLARGFHGATLEAIAGEAGFSKGVVYSQFENKSDLFLAILAQRAQERAQANLEAAAGLSGLPGLLAWIETAGRDHDAEAPWHLLVAEFRVHAARDPVLNGRYRDLHERTIDGIAAALEALFANSGEVLDLPARLLATTVFALSVGVALERAASPSAMPTAEVHALLERIFRASPQARPRRSK